MKVQGNTQGLKASQSKALTRLGQRRFPVMGGYTLEQARELAALSRSVGRQIGLLIDRQGRVEMVIVGTPSAIFIPELPRARSGAGRLRGLRLLHTHLTGDLLSQEDLMDLLFLRLDGLAVLTVDEWGGPMQLQRAHLLPQRDIVVKDGMGGTVKTTAGQAHTTYPAVAWDKVDTDFSAEVEALEDEMARAVPEAKKASDGPRAVLVSVSTAPKSLQELNLAELTELARTAGVEIVGTVMQRVATVNPRLILGKGKLAELEVMALQGNASMVIFDGELAPAQLRNLADVTERKVLDRTQLILDIFAQHATTRAGKLQVEMAQLQYTMPRLVGKNQAMDRLAGGIGGRGPGETKLETDRRRIRERIDKIRSELKALRKQRAFARARRAKQRVPLASLVGYTNAGKSTLLNALTNADVLAENKLFATLDPTTRRLRFPHERELILADTVGFIRNLPKELLEAFRATLEELEAADLLIHVADAGHPELDRQLKAVEDILIEMGMHETPRLLILNKWDTVPADLATTLLLEHPEAIPVAAVERKGLGDVAAAIASRIDWEHALRQGGEAELSGISRDWADGWGDEMDIIMQ